MSFTFSQIRALCNLPPSLFLRSLFPLLVFVSRSLQLVGESSLTESESAFNMTEDKDRNPDTTGDSAKRKLEDPGISILLAKQKAQEIAARLVGNAESKRPRVLDDDSFQSNPVYTPPAYPGTHSLFQFLVLSRV